MVFCFDYLSLIGLRVVVFRGVEYCLFVLVGFFLFVVGWIFIGFCLFGIDMIECFVL